MEAYIKDITVSEATESTLTVCWKFENEEYSFMPKYAVSVYEIQGASPARAIQGQPKTFSYVGTEVKEGDFVRYTTGASCDADYATFEGLPEKKVTSDHTVELAFDHASMNPFKLCYKFDEEPYKQYDMPVEVATVTSLYYGGKTYQSLSLSLAKDYTISVAGINIHAGDRVQWLSLIHISEPTRP